MREREACAPAGLFPRKAKNRPFGWKISLSTCPCLPDFSPGRPKNGLSDGKSLSAHVRACRTFPPEGQKTAFRMELFSFCACGGGRLLCEERRRAIYDRSGVHYSLSLLISRRVCAHRIHWTAGKLPFRLQSEHRVRSNAAAECSFTAGHAQRSRRLRRADPHPLLQR